MSPRPHSPELAAVELHGMTRSAFILRGALAAGAMYGAGAVGPFVSGALAQSEADLEILNFALTLERLEFAFYEAAKGADLPADLKQLVTEFGGHEEAHAATLEETIKQLGGKPPPAAEAKFDVGDRDSVLRLAVQLEDIGVAAYNGAGPQLTTPDLINAAGAIVQTEARHAAALRFRLGENPAPDAFDRALAPPEVEAALRQVSGG
jgi:rubrerythrin